MVNKNNQNNKERGNKEKGRNFRLCGHDAARQKKNKKAFAFFLQGVICGDEESIFMVNEYNKSGWGTEKNPVVPTSK